MKLVEAVAEDVTIVEAYGRIDSTTAREFGDRLVSLVQAGSASLFVDLKNIAYISSAGFRALRVASRRAGGKGGKRAAGGRIGEGKGQVDIGGLTNEFVICPTQADGIGKLRQ